MKWLNVIKGLSSTLNWIFSYSQQKNLFGKVGFAIPLSPFPFIPQKKLHSGKSASFKGLGHNFKNSDFHCANPARKKAGTLHSQSPSLKSSPL